MMSFKTTFVLLFLALALVPNNATQSPAELYWKSKVGDITMSPAELYWKSNVGDITMPKVIKDSLPLGSNDQTTKIDPHHQSHVALDDEMKSMNGYALPSINPQFHVPLDLEEFWLAYAHPTKDQQLKGHLNSMNKHSNPIQDAQNDEVKTTHTMPLTLYFTPETLIAGKKVRVHFKNIDNGAKFLQLQVAKTMETSSNKLDMMLNVLSLDSKSRAAKYIEKTISVCEQKGVEDEVRSCAASLESMVDFVTSNLNSKNPKFKAISTQVDQDSTKEYVIQKTQVLANEYDQTMVCHKMGNPYAVFLCHSLSRTDIYGVSMVDAKGKQTKAIAICHKHTSTWNPGHLAFEVLKTKPGSTPICHFTSGDTVVWLRN